MWCRVLASKRFTRFDECHVHRIAGNNLQSLLRRRQSVDASIADAADLVVFNYAAGALPFVQQPVAGAMLGSMEDLVESSIGSNLQEIGACVQNLAMLVSARSGCD